MRSGNAAEYAVRAREVTRASGAFPSSSTTRVVEERTATINRIRGLLSEFGFVLPQKAIAVRRGVPALLDQLPALAGRALTDLYAHLSLLDERIRDYERQIVQLAHQNEAACRLMAITGVGVSSTGQRNTICSN